DRAHHRRCDGNRQEPPALCPRQAAWGVAPASISDSAVERVMTESTDKQLLDQAAADEQQLDEYLKGDSSVSRQYRELPGAEVPAELDRIVLRQAADAVQTLSTGRPAWMRWKAPLAVAASAVLVLSIVIETGPKDETAQVMSDLSVAVSARKAEQALESDRIGGATEETAGGEAIVSGQAAPVQAPAMAPAPRLEAQAS